jgi:hypothetical protein
MLHLRQRISADWRQAASAGLLACVLLLLLLLV